MNVTPKEKNDLHDWIDNEVPQMIENAEIVFDEESLKMVEKKVTELLKQYFG